MFCSPGIVLHSPWPTRYNIVMVEIRKTTNILPFGRASSKEVSPSGAVSETSSPFATKPTETLKGILERKSSLLEDAKLAILRKALQPFATEASSHLPQDLSSIEKKVRRKMLEEGFSEVVAEEAGEEAVSVSLTHRRVIRKLSTKDV